ncbi:MAG: FG-GAP-like repeat-containing protein [Bryobacteraceae bacterium]
MKTTRYGRAAGVAAVLLGAPIYAGLTFIPDSTFKGSSLAEWHTLGEASWRAQAGEIVGTVKPGGSGGWLFLNQSYQDVGFHALFRCTGGCKAGVMIRAEKTADGFKGIYVSLDEENVPSFGVTLDSQGKELQRERLRSIGGLTRVAPVPDPAAAAARGGAGRGGAGRGAPQVTLPFTRPATILNTDDWNQIEIFLDANIVRSHLNNANTTTGVSDHAEEGYGPLALYVGGAGEVRFKEIAFKDVGMKETPAEIVSPNFRMQRISDMSYSWSAAAADFNRDGVTDIIAGPYIYYGPDFTKSREIFLATTYSPSSQLPATNCEYAYDFNGDGWPDVLTGTGRPALYINPKGESRRWQKYVVLPNVQSEITLLRDVDGDGRPDLVYGADGTVRYATYDPADPTKPWTVHSVSEPGYAAAHGLGVGDINGDGRMDIVNPYGWWEQPAAGSKQELWTYHPQAFSRASRTAPGGSVMAVYDVNGDGLNDVVTSLSGHGFGLAWYEQKRDAAGNISFVEHMIADDFSAKNAGGVAFSEQHGSTFADVDGDGIPDFIVGKRYWSHADTYLDPDPNGAPVLYWYRTVRNPKAPGGAEFIPELIHNRSGAGSDLLAVDLNNDGAMDIVTSTGRGTFIFWGKPRAGAAKKAAGHK